MIKITLPDNSQREYPGPVTGADIAASIGPGLAKAALAVKVNGDLKDLTATITTDANVSIITAKSSETLELVRHDCAHIMAQAVQELFPGTQVTFGPATETGFYYDFYREQPFSTDDLEVIEKRMHEIVDRDLPLIREEWSREQAIEWFTKQGESFKAEWIPQLPANEALSIYRQGDWLDLCRGPHLPSTGKTGHAFKLMRVSGAYWRGDAKNAQLQRITGTAWRTQAELDQYLFQLAEAEKRDHRKLGKEMGLFHQQEEAAGMIFWHPKGWALYRTLENFIRGRLQEDYVEVKTPQLIDSSLFKASGHWDMYGDNMYKVAVDEERMFGLKPMNCPGHVQIFRQGIKSYRDLPLRFAEFGSCHRNEPSGGLHGIMRVRAFTQDDGHIFCREDQIRDESLDYFKLQLGVYEALGFSGESIQVKLALRPDVRAGEDNTWDRAEQGLRDALNAAGLAFEELPGEGAFYGPKVEFHLTDAIGRTWQCGTLQLDFVLPERLDATYIGEDGARHRPVMLHRAILGSLERFIGMLIEHYAGRLPLWLSPAQVVVTTITNEADGYAAEVHAALKAAGLKADLDLRAEKINYKVRDHSLAKIPVIIAVGKRESEERTVTLRRLGGDKQEVLALTDALTRLREEAAVPGA
ncbi:threonine--tRNA ligase [Lacibacterium aquatile]|uniref:Threonine--tRNA ligase n=1 Tax=Lacibacterium aquatile TaxID=1168082 RepID=A0ABW5DS86_9PROT